MSAEGSAMARGELVIDARLLEHSGDPGDQDLKHEGAGVVVATTGGLFWQLGENRPSQVMPWRSVADWHLAEFTWWRAVVTATLEDQITVDTEPERMRVVVVLTTMRRQARQLTDIAAAHRPGRIRWESVAGSGQPPDGGEG